MKLPPRDRTPAKVYEMEPESGYLLLFKCKENAHKYTKDSLCPYKTNGKGRRQRKKKAKTTSVNKGKAANVAKATKTKAKAVVQATVPQLSSTFAPPLVPMSQKQCATAVKLAREGSTTHRWEFADDNGGWSPYDKDASNLVEMEYQSWLQQPEVFVRSVQSGYFHYSVNFNTMEQTNIKHKNRRVRKIRRVAVGLSDAAATAPKATTLGGIFTPPSSSSSIPLPGSGALLSGNLSASAASPQPFAASSPPPLPAPASAPVFSSGLFMPFSSYTPSPSYSFAPQQQTDQQHQQSSGNNFGVTHSFPSPAAASTGQPLQQRIAVPEGCGVWSYTMPGTFDTYPYSKEMNDCIERAYRVYASGWASPTVCIKVPNTLFYHEFDFEKMSAKNFSSPNAPPVTISRS